MSLVESFSTLYQISLFSNSSLFYFCEILMSTIFPSPDFQPKPSTSKAPQMGKRKKNIKISKENPVKQSKQDENTESDTESMYDCGQSSNNSNDDGNEGNSLICISLVQPLISLSKANLR